MIIPFNNTFASAKSLSKYSNVILLLSTFIIVLAFIVRSFYYNYYNISGILDSVNCFLIPSYVIIEFILNNKFYEASIHRRCDFIDNSFDTTYSEENSMEYYSNDDIKNGIYKMAVNGFENAFFTFNIAKRMMKNLWIKNAILITTFIFLGVVGYSSAFVMFIQLSLPAILLNQALKHTMFVNKINRVYENYRKLFHDLRNENNKENKSPEIIINIIEYESTLSWGTILLDTDIYNSLNKELSEKWAKIKRKYNVK
jgi:hypothetical protein